MLKYAFLAGSMIVAAPVAAQTMTPAPQTATPQTTAPATTSPEPAMPATDPATTTPAPTSDPAATGDTTASTTAQPASGDQVAGIVDKEFATYDKDANGGLNQSEFSSWMVTLRSASDPSMKADSAETKTWLKGAFAQADKDKSKTVTKTELTGFLSQGAS